MAKPLRLRNDHQKAIANKFEGLLRSGRHSRWTIWSDFIAMAACTLSMADFKKREERERLYADIAKKYTQAELEQFSSMFSEVINAFEENPEQDLLGELFMRLELGNDHNGQFFTPYNVCVAMAMMSAGNLEAEITRKGYVSVNDPCCGAGALLIAFANEAKRLGINYQQHVEFVAQDIDFTAAMMCYIQLSLLGCAGYVIVGNTLTTPPTEPLTNQNVWYTPLYFLDVWHWRRTIKALFRITERTEIPDQPDTIMEKPLKGKYELKEGPNGQLSLF
ncbi:MAG: N-6 DNA methylase [Vallitaleaceae bacterium]|nr:N-6 DNA methylase [Vallitaleaceae bacterium]